MQWEQGWYIEWGQGWYRVRAGMVWSGCRGGME